MIKKALLDFIYAGKRSIIAYIAMALGMIFFGLMLFSNEVINREISEIYKNIHPASAVINVKGENNYSKLEKLIENYSGIKYYEVIPVVERQILTENDGKKAVYIFGTNGATKAVNKLNWMEGCQERLQGEAYIEYAAKDTSNAMIGDTVQLQKEDGSVVPIQVVGCVNDVVVYPAKIHDCVYLYMNKEDVIALGEGVCQIELIFEKLPYEVAEIERQCTELTSFMEKNGYVVTGIDIAENPGISMHAGEYESVMYLLQFFSLIAFLFGTMIMGNLFASILAAQTKQIGVLKAIGISRKQLLTAYIIATMLVMSITTIIAYIVVVVTNSMLCRFLMGISNMIPVHCEASIAIRMIFLIVCMAVSIGIVVFQVNRKLNITIKEAFDEVGIATDVTIISQTAGKTISTLKSLPLKNLFRRKSRLILNLLMLVSGGFVFIAALTTQLSLKSTLGAYMDTLSYDYEITTNEDRNQIMKSIRFIPEIGEYEIWNIGSAVLEKESSDGIQNSYELVAPERNTTFLVPEVVEGKWIDDIESGDGNAVVVTNNLLEIEGLHVGEQIILKGKDNEQVVRICGVINTFETKSVYLSNALYHEIVGNQEGMLGIKCRLTGDRNRAFFRRSHEILEESGLLFLSEKSKEEMTAELFRHYQVTLNSFVIVSVLLVIVAGFGLMASMNIQVEERKKEVGIMRAIGMKQKAIMGVFEKEGFYLSNIAFVLSAVFGSFCGYLGCNIFGSLVCEKPIVMNVGAFIITLGIWYVFCMLVSILSIRICVSRGCKLAIKNLL